MTIEGIDQPGTLEIDTVVVRTMQPGDVQAVVSIDAVATGRRRPKYFERMLQRAVEQADFQVSIIAELDQQVVGFIIATLFYGEYGVAEPSASIDAIAVHPEFRGHHVGKALMRQLRLNLGALRIERLRTEVAWNDYDLLAFFHSNGFAPAGRLCLERVLDPTAPED